MLSITHRTYLAGTTLSHLLFNVYFYGFNVYYAGIPTLLVQRGCTDDHGYSAVSLQLMGSHCCSRNRHIGYLHVSICNRQQAHGSGIG